MTGRNRKAAGPAGIAVAVLLLASLLPAILMLRPAAGGKQEKEGQKAGKGETAEQGEVYLFRRMPEVVLEDEHGAVVRTDFTGGISVLLFWASWCPHCRETVPFADSLGAAAEEAGARLWLIDKLDGEKETKEQALKLLQEEGLSAGTLFDSGCRTYEELGLSMLPTALVVDRKGRIIAMSEGAVPSEEELKGMIAEAQEGKAAVLASVICRTLVGEEGGFRTNYLPGGEGQAAGGDILSESQGILMEYAARTGDKELFERVWEYSKRKLTAEGLMPWVISDRQDTGVNALIDDLRILGALQLADGRWEEYDADCRRIRDAIYDYNTKDGLPVDFYDSGSGQKAGRFTLCYGDLSVLSRMREQDGRFAGIYDNTLKLMLEGRISEKFPLYYSYYDYDTDKYEGGRLNMAEALTTLLHLAEAGELPQEALGWLEQEMGKGRVYAAYTMDGKPAADGYYESTAVYALLAMIALEEGDERLAGLAVKRMEQLRVTEAGSGCFGLYGNSDGSGIYSFDQGMALLAYEKFEEVTGD